MCLCWSKNKLVKYEKYMEWYLLRVFIWLQRIFFWELDALKPLQTALATTDFLFLYNLSDQQLPQLSSMKWVWDYTGTRPSNAFGGGFIRGLLSRQYAFGNEHHHFIYETVHVRLCL